jgi:hypothetical protein
LTIQKRDSFEAHKASSLELLNKPEVNSQLSKVFMDGTDQVKIINPNPKSQMVQGIKGAAKGIKLIGGIALSAVSSVASYVTGGPESDEIERPYSARKSFDYSNVVDPLHRKALQEFEDDENFIKKFLA